MTLRWPARKAAVLGAAMLMLSATGGMWSTAVTSTSRACWTRFWLIRMPLQTTTSTTLPPCICTSTRRLSLGCWSNTRASKPNAGLTSLSGWSRPALRPLPTRPGWRPDPTFRVSLLEQAAYMPQGLALALAAGAERVSIYKLVDAEDDYVANPEPFGLIHADGSPRPAFTTARIAFEMLARAGDLEQAPCCLTGRCREAGPAYPHPMVLRACRAGRRGASIGGVGDPGRHVWGNASPLEPADGVYEILLYAGECQQTAGDYCMIGGPPVYLVEPLVPEAAASGQLPPCVVLQAV